MFRFIDKHFMLIFLTGAFTKLCFKLFYGLHLYIQSRAFSFTSMCILWCFMFSILIFFRCLKRKNLIYINLELQIYFFIISHNIYSLYNLK